MRFAFAEPVKPVLNSPPFTNIFLFFFIRIRPSSWQRWPLQRQQQLQHQRRRRRRRKRRKTQSPRMTTWALVSLTKLHLLLYARRSFIIRLEFYTDLIYFILICLSSTKIDFIKTGEIIRFVHCGDHSTPIIFSRAVLLGEQKEQRGANYKHSQNKQHFA